MPAQTKDIQRRLKSVRSIKKITRAMELVAASKMRKSVARVVSSRSYAEAAWQMVLNIVPKIERAHHPLLEERPMKRAAIVVISSNRGLCGAFNMNVVSKALDLVKKEGWGRDAVDFITFGKQGAQLLTTLKKNIVADYAKDDITDAVVDVLPVSQEVMRGFLSGAWDEVCLAYTDFRSSLTQEARIRHLLPLVKPSRYLGRVGKNVDNDARRSVSEYLFEPSRDAVLAKLLPRLVEVQMYQAVLESEASEHSARMMAMRNATDAAVDMLDSLTLAYNKARQEAITAELAEISAATAALS